MTNERLDQILKQALSPEVSDLDIEIRKKERKYNMKKIIKSGIAVAACLAVAVTIGVGNHYFKYNDVNSGNNTPFVLTVCAEELTPEKEVPIIIDNKHSWGLNGDPETGTVSYNIETFFKCEGENIDHITYSINQGAFQISEIQEKSILLSEKPYEGELNTGVCGVIFDENDNIISTEKYLTEYTLDYDAQTNDTTTFAICGEKNNFDMYNTLWGEERDLNNIAKAYTNLVDGVEVTCTVYFNDGTCSAKTITVEGKVMKNSEVGFDMEDANTEDTFFVFKLK